MFEGSGNPVLIAPAPPQLDAAELKAQEQEAAFTVQKMIAGAVLLYMCTCLDIVFPIFIRVAKLTVYLIAPFAIDVVKKLL